MADDQAQVAASRDAESIRLALSVDASRIASVYARAGRVLVHGLFERATAERLYRSLTEEVPWQLHFNGADGVYDLASGQLEALDAEARSRLMTAIHAGAASGFQYLFRNYPISDEYAAGRGRGHFLMSVLEFLNSPAFLEFVRKVTGAPGITNVDAQATCYGPGHFLTQHDDTAADKHRVAAYVIGMTPLWRPDWGGLLNFIARDGHVAEAFAPTFNSLTIFRVPQLHSVGIVAPFARYGRFSISGWLRTEGPSAG